MCFRSSKTDSTGTNKEQQYMATKTKTKAGHDYKPVTPEILGWLREIVGDKNVHVDEEKVEAYSHDETNADEYGHMPEVVVTPTTPEQISDIVKLANRELVPITPRGAGSGLSGGAIPTFGGILLSVEKMNKVIELDIDNMAITVEAGMVTNDLAQMVQEKKLFFAGYPMSLQSCYIGGNIAENAGGGKAVKYGVTGRYVLGVEVVTPSGDIVWLGGKLAKDVSGYDLKQLLIGSEGTLGIVTKAIIRLIGYPTASSDLLVLFNTPREAIDVVPTIMSRGLVPTSIEFMDQLSVRTSCAYLNETLPYEEAGAMLLIEIDGSNPGQVEAEMIAMGELCEEHGALEVYVAENSTTKERIWSVRRNIAEAFKVYSPIQSLEDIVVPMASIPEIIPELERLSEKYGMQIPCYGHAGDGNLHATLVKAPEMDMETWHKNEADCLRELYRVTTKLGGKISGEHGIGIKRKSYLAEVINPVELELMRSIKRAWDPNIIMNPGKIFDLDTVQS
jgi:glycolate oxidase